MEGSWSRPRSGPHEIRWLHSYELLARYVMPRFQGTLSSLTVSNQWSRDHTEYVTGKRELGLDKAQRVWAERR